MAAPSKTANTSLLSLQSIATATATISSAVDVSTKIGAFVGIHFGRRSVTALTGGAIFRLEGSYKTSGDGHWFVIVSYPTGVATAETEAVTGTVSAGTNVITVASTANLTAGDIIYIDNGTIANSEWGRIKSIVANTSVTIEDNLVNAQTSSTIYDQAEIISWTVDLTTIQRIRLVVDTYTGPTGVNVAVEASMSTWDTFA